MKISDTSRGICSILAVAIACILSSIHQRAVPFEHAAFLIPAALALWVKTSSSPFALLQKTIGAIVCMIPIWQLKNQHVAITMESSVLNISYATLLFGLVLFGHAMARIGFRLQKGVSLPTSTSICGWPQAFAIVFGHALLLGAMLAGFYGYGFHRSPEVLGWICCLYLVCKAFSATLERLRWRRILALVSLGYYVAVSVGLS